MNVYLDRDGMTVHQSTRANLKDRCESVSARGGTHTRTTKVNLGKLTTVDLSARKRRSRFFKKEK